MNNDITTNTHFGISAIKREHPFWFWFTIFGIAFSIIWSIFIYFYPSKDNLSPNVKTDSVAPVSDLRNTLIEPIFDIASKLYQFKTDYEKNDFINERKNDYFNGAGTITDFGKFSNGEIWASFRGNTADGNTGYFECHFDNSWENTIKNILDTEKINVKFEGQIGYYTKGVLFAVNCKIINIEN